ncbi:alpha/beta fold hydrolase [Devosia sp. UYZn731]|uniref:alpha/beta fold hydrolase n=1 Tax=Devosia sp. UYZn731 TaxID=3156345 RepID=UPI00339916E2
MSRVLAAEGFRVVRYDRRGRGKSGDKPHSTIQQEVMDIAALARQADGPVSLWGMSSGGILSLMAAAQLPKIRRVATYEVPVLFDRSHASMAKDWDQIASCVERADLSGAVASFLAMVGMPAPIRTVLRILPLWGKLCAIAPTLRHDRDLAAPFLTASEDSLRLLPRVACELLVTAGNRSPDWLVSNNRRLAGQYSQAQYVLIDRDDHMVRPKHHRNVLSNFFGEPS